MDPESLERLRVEFGRAGTQYYLAGRFAYLGRLVPVAGNLFHHAVEMLLKAQLVRRVPLDDLKEKYSHKLTKLWAEFKNQVLDPDGLSSFDALIIDLDRFEDIRYPDKIVSEGMMMTLAVARGTRTVVSSAGPLPPEYSLTLEDIDEAVQAILTAASVNPDFFLGNNLQPEPKRFYEMENRHRHDSQPRGA